MSVFVVNNLNSLEIAHSLISDGDYLVLLDKGIYPAVKKGVWSKVFCFDSPNKLSFYISLHRLRKAIFEMQKKGNLYIPNINSPVCNNLLFYSVSWDAVYCLEEGTLNATMYLLKEELLNSIVKKVICNFFFIKYKVMLKHFSGLDLAGLVGVYTLGNSAVQSFEKPIYVVDGNQRNTFCSESANNCLVIGQYLEDFISEDVLREMLKKVNIFLGQKIGVEKIYYKPHPRKKSCVESEFFSLYDQVTKVDRAENLITELNIGIVVGICSSVLVNVKRDFPDLDVVAIGIDELAEENIRFRELKELFLSCEINCK
ncbi:polysialyltransferase family glycosyltransferase [Pseudoalteromonas piscicida]|uniref:polysialyltransferase family glycosyltransferase n=1 Tax=Pseudoalteromonas piscicida TaxID=43662 RepID=UPI0032C0E69C